MIKSYYKKLKANKYLMFYVITFVFIFIFSMFFISSKGDNIAVVDKKDKVEVKEQKSDKTKEVEVDILPPDDTGNDVLEREVSQETSNTVTDNSSNKNIGSENNNKLIQPRESVPKVQSNTNSQFTTFTISVGETSHIQSIDYSTNGLKSGRWQAEPSDVVKIVPVGNGGGADVTGVKLGECKLTFMSDDGSTSPGYIFKVDKKVNITPNPVYVSWGGTIIVSPGFVVKNANWKANFISSVSVEVLNLDDGTAKVSGRFIDDGSLTFSFSRGESFTVPLHVINFSLNYPGLMYRNEGGYTPQVIYSSNYYPNPQGIWYVTDENGNSVPENELRINPSTGEMFVGSNAKSYYRAFRKDLITQQVERLNVSIGDR